MPTTNSGILIPFPLNMKKGESYQVEVEVAGSIQEVNIPWWLISPEQEAKKKELLTNQFFLLRQGPLGEISKCTRCGRKERHFTLMCVERPFDGLKEGLLAYYHHAGKHGAEKFLTGVELTRYEKIREVVAKIGGPTDLSSSHPQFAKSLNTEDDDFDIGALSLGLLEPITRAKAIALSWNINLRGVKPPFILEGLKNAIV